MTGGVLGNIADLYEFPIPLHGFSSLFLGIFGLQWESLWDAW